MRARMYVYIAINLYAISLDASKPAMMVLLAFRSLKSLRKIESRKEQF